MRLTLMDKSFNLLSVFDNWESLIWTERYCDYSDFEIVFLATRELVEMFKRDYYVISSDSPKMMIIESVEIKTNFEDGDQLIIKGRSLESILDRRVIYKLTRFGISDEEGAEHLPAAPSGYTMIKYAYATEGAYYNTGLTPTSNNFFFKGSFARIGQIPDKEVILFGYGSDENLYDNGITCFIGESHRYVDILLGGDSKYKHIPYSLSKSTTSGKNVMLQVTQTNTDKKYHFYNESGDLTGKLSGNIYGANKSIYVFDRNGYKGTYKQAKNVIQFSYVEFQVNNQTYRFYPVKSTEDDSVKFPRYKLVNTSFVLDTDFDWQNGTHGTFIAGPEEKYQAVQVYKAATAIVHKNLVDNDEQDAFWGNQKNRDIPGLTVKDTGTYTDELVTNWTMVGSYYGESVFQAIQDILQNRRLGFKIEPVQTNPKRNSWVFEVYSGKDRSYSQNKVLNEPYVVFSTEYGNISELNYLSSSEEYKNVAFVMGENEILNKNSSSSLKLVMKTSSIPEKLIIDGKTYWFMDPETGMKYHKYVIKTAIWEATIDYEKLEQDHFLILKALKDITIGGQQYSAGTLVGNFDAAVSFTAVYDENQITLATRRCAFTDNTISGLDRRETMVDGTSCASTYTDPDGNTVSYSDDVYNSILVNKGAEEISGNKILTSFEGSLEASYEESPFIYRRDFELGDLVSVKDNYGNVGNVRIMEMIFSSDGEGDRWYPTVQSEEEELILT